MTKADAAVDRTMVLRRGGERLVTTDGRRAASRRVVVVVVVSRDLILGLVDDDGICGVVLPVGRTKALQLLDAAKSSTADRNMRGMIIFIISVS